MKQKSLFTITVILYLFCACSEQGNWPEVEPQATLSVSKVGFSFQASEDASKAYFDVGDEIGLHVYSRQGIDFHKLTFMDTGWTLECPIPLSGSPTDIYACYPYDIQNDVPIAFEIEHTSRTDYLYSDMHSANSTDQVLTLTMKHALALIEFEFEPSPTFDNGLIDFISIDGGALHSKAKLNLLTSELEYINGSNEPSVIYGWQMDIPFIRYDTKIGLMVVPVKKVQDEGDISINMLINRVKCHWSVPAGTTWESGKKYTYRVHILDSRLEITDVWIDDWRDAGSKKITLPYY